MKRRKMREVRWDIVSMHSLLVDSRFVFFWGVHSFTVFIFICLWAECLRLSFRALRVSIARRGRVGWVYEKIGLVVCGFNGHRGERVRR